MFMKKCLISVIFVVLIGLFATSQNMTPSPKTYTIDGVSFVMNYIPGGKFIMGANEEFKELKEKDIKDELPAHEVELSPFWIGETEVTVALWRAVTGKDPEHYVPGVNYPITYVSWDDCQVFIKKLNEITNENFRLPTEAEWEYAARGGRNNLYRYSGGPVLSDIGINNNMGVQPVKSSLPNSFGLYFMSGNVREWCSDYYGNYSPEKQVNPQGASTSQAKLRVQRGGSYFDNPKNCRVTSRARDAQSGSANFVGFRLAK